VDFDQLSPRTQPEIPIIETVGGRRSVDHPPRIDTLTANGSAGYASPPSVEGHEWNANGDVYRQKLEALKNEVGEGWLSVLGEERWDHSRRMNGSNDFSSRNNIRPSVATTRSNNQAIVTGGRSLG
jgi:hypothetical protein